MDDSASNSFSLYGEYDSYNDHSDTSEDTTGDLADLVGVTSQYGKPHVLPKSDYFNSNGALGMATCEMCSTVGVKHAFYSKSKRFCSLACSRAFSARKKTGKPGSVKRIKVESRKATIVPQDTKSVSETSTFSWHEYLSTHDVHAAPVSCFKHCPMADSWDGIHVGMKVETPNTDVDLPKTVYWIATVLKVAGYKALLCYEGMDAESGPQFWVNLCSKDIHEVGWCASTGNSLVPPNAIKDKYSDWKEFLVKRLIGSRTLPNKFYDMVKECLDKCRLRRGMQVEVIDKSRVSAMRVATIDEVIGGRLHLLYNGQKIDDFWCHHQSPLVHPVGWSERMGHKLHASEDYKEACATKIATNKFDKDDSTPDMFEKVESPPHGMTFHVGMKLEAIDPLNLSAICVSSVTKILRDNYLMICIDGSREIDGSDWFCYHATSPCLLPAGFCEINSIDLTPPKGYTKHTFRWADYLRLTQSLAAPVKLFEKVMRNHGFRVGMKLEAVDLMDPRLICVGTVVRVVGRLLRIHFDGWEGEYDQWIDCESPDLYPVGWCDFVKYPLEGPRVNPDENPIPLYTKRKAKAQIYRGPRKKRKTKGEKGETKPVMYEGGDNADEGVTVKLEPLSPSQDDSSEAIIDPMYGGGESRDGLYSLESLAIKQEPTHIFNTAPTPAPLASSSLAASRPALAATLLSPSMSPTKTTAPAFPTSAAIKAMLGRPGDKVATNRSPSNSVKVVTHIPRFLVMDSDRGSSSLLTKMPTSSSSASTGAASKPVTQPTQSIVPELWSVYNVCQFLKINDCGSYCESFSRKGIDGKKLLQLSKEQIASLTGMKVGPSLKVYELIQQLKSKITDSGSGAVRDAVNLQQS